MSDLPGIDASAQDAFGSDEPPRRASTLGYWLAALLVLAAFAGGGAWIWAGFSRLDDSVDELQRLDVPGRGVFTLEEGDGSVYYEGPGEPYLTIRMNGTDGTPVDVGQHGGEVTYDFGGHSGTSYFGYEIERAGEYEVEIDGPSGGVIAFGEGVGGQIVAAVVGALVIFFGCLGAAIILLVITRKRRRRPV